MRFVASAQRPSGYPADILCQSCAFGCGSCPRKVARADVSQVRNSRNVTVIVAQIWRVKARTSYSRQSCFDQIDDRAKAIPVATDRPPTGFQAGRAAVNDISEQTAADGPPRGPTVSDSTGTVRPCANVRTDGPNRQPGSPVWNPCRSKHFFLNNSYFQFFSLSMYFLQTGRKFLLS